MEERISKSQGKRPRWIVDLGPGGTWTFPTYKSARAFVALVDGGMEPKEANYILKDAPVPGTPPDTSIHLGPERRAWLKRQGGIQSTIHKMVDQAMNEDKILAIEDTVNLAARLVVDVMTGRVTTETIERAKELVFTDATFLLMLAGGNPDNLDALTSLVRDELERLP